MNGVMDHAPKNRSRSFARRLAGSVVLLALAAGALAGVAELGLVPRVGLVAAALVVAAVAVSNSRARAERFRVAYSETVQIDALTAALNARGLDEAARRELQAAARAGDPCSLVLYEVENYDRLGDSFGEAAGDAALVTTADFLRAACRPRDRIARIGRSHFAALLPDTPRDAAAAVAERMRTGVTPAGVGLVYGVAAAPEDGATLDELVQTADAALKGVELLKHPTAVEEPNWAPDDVVGDSATSAS